MSPADYVEILLPNDSIGRWGFGERLGLEGRALINGISALIKKTLALPPCKDTTGSVGSRRGPSPDQAGTLITDFQSPELEL